MEYFLGLSVLLNCAFIIAYFRRRYVQKYTFKGGNGLYMPPKGVKSLIVNAFGGSRSRMMSDQDMINFFNLEMGGSFNKSPEIKKFKP